MQCLKLSFVQINIKVSAAEFLTLHAASRECREITALQFFGTRCFPFTSTSFSWPNFPTSSIFFFYWNR